jgi:Fe-S-cluster-containing hydrogenase component 2
VSGRLVVEADRCTGCGSCVLACSLAQEGAFSLALSRIRILRNEELAEFSPRVCIQCPDVPCITSCPVGALSRDADTGAIKLDREACTGCRQCVVACPYGGVQFDQSRDIPLICDLCGGDPACIKACQLPQAIRYIQDVAEGA